MTDRVDLLVLSVREPLADAVCATVCRRWREAADLWLDVLREPRYRALAACCGLEASLQAGLYDLAQYFRIGVEESPGLDDHLTEPWRQSLPIRRARARFHAQGVAASSDADPRRVAQNLADLRLYREAVREVFRAGLLKTDRAAAVVLLAACYFSLGEHEAMTALHASQGPHFAGPGARMMLQNAEACLDRAAKGPVENALEFARLHPAGARLSQFLDLPAVAPHA